MHIGCCLNPVEGSFLLFRFVSSGWLDSLRALREVFLAVAEFVGFREGGRLPFE